MPGLLLFSNPGLFMYKLLLLLFLFIDTGVKAQTQGPGIGKFEMKTIEGKKYVLNDFEKLRVFIFLSPGCPLSQKYTLTLNELAKEFQDKAEFYGVFAETNPVLNDYKDFKKKYKIRFTLFVDKEKKLVKTLTASVTPEAFVISKGKVVYHGAIDDWAIELGKTKKSSTINFVRNALICAIANKTPVPDYSKPIGCFID